MPHGGGALVGMTVAMSMVGKQIFISFRYYKDGLEGNNKFSSTIDEALIRQDSKTEGATPTDVFFRVWVFFQSCYSSAPLHTHTALSSQHPPKRKTQMS